MHTNQKPDGLTGLFGHELEDGYADRQFMVLRRMDARRWLIRCFSWLDGAPTCVEVLDEASLLDRTRCRLYETSEQMREAYEHGGMRRPAPPMHTHNPQNPPPTPIVGIVGMHERKGKLR